MTSFVFTNVSEDPAMQIFQLANALSFTKLHWQWSHSTARYVLVVTRVDSQELWLPYFDPDAGMLFVLNGRIAFDASEWTKLRQFREQGCTGLICRYIASLWHEREDTIVENLNGAFALVVWHIAAGVVTVVTDRLGVFPVFATESGSLHLSTHPDVLRKASNMPLEFDFGTMAESLAFGSSTHPYSYYKGIVQLNPATVYRFHLADRQKNHRRQYWKPIYRPQQKFNVVVDQIAQAISNAVLRRTAYIDGTPGVFLSGGVDSRSILFSLPKQETSTAITFYEESAGETLIAETLARRAQVKHILLKRDDDYYFKAAQKVMRIAGGMWNIVDAHFFGYVEELAARNFAVILSGCYADYMFKGLLQNRMPLRVLGLTTGLVKRGQFQLWYYLWRKPIAGKWSEITLDRLRNRLSGLAIPPKSDDDRLELEGRRLIPLSREGDWLFRNLAWRTLPFDLLFADSEIIDAYLSVPIKYKLNGLGFREAVSRICNAACDIPDANSGLPINASRIAVVLDHFRRKYLLSQPSLLPSSADFNALIARSTVLQRLWAEHGVDEAEILSDLLGYNPFARSLVDWAENNATTQFYRIFSLMLWLRGVLASD